MSNMTSNIFTHVENRSSTTETAQKPVARIMEGNNSIIINDKEAIDELNVYRNWGVFGLTPEYLEEEETDSNGKSTGVKKVSFLQPYPEFSSVIGTKSLFNNVNAVRYNTTMQIENNSPLLDSPEFRRRIKSRGDCSVKELVRASSNNEMGRAIYNYSDFMFCKHLGRTSNNYLVTLRRFPFPCGDHINFTLQDDEYEKKINEHMPDIGRLVTWMGTPGNEMSNILKYSVNMPWEEVRGEFQTIQGNAENGGIMGAIMNLSSSKYANNAIAGIGGDEPLKHIGTGMKYAGGAIGKIPGLGFVGGGLNSWAGALSGPPANISEAAYNRDQTKTYGNADVISKSHKRRDPDQGGLEFTHDITLVFDYELRSYDGINGRAAFLDLLSNILAVTYTNGKFWGGGYRGSGQSQLNAFTNLPIYNMLKPDSTEPFSFSNLVNATMDSVSQISRQFSKKPDGSDGNILDAIKNLASNMGKALLGGTLNALGRPEKQALNSLVSPAPVGLWHLTIGNPKHPIMSIGNMILKSTEIEHYGPLGFDDFPTGIKVTITLQHAKPRDASNIENMYYMGDYRIYQPMGKHISYMYEASSPYKQQRSTFQNNQDVLASPNAETTDIKEHNDATTKTQERYMKYFGTRSGTNISWAAQEGHLGSQKAKTAEEAKKEQQEVAAQLNANK